MENFKTFKALVENVGRTRHVRPFFCFESKKKEPVGTQGEVKSSNDKKCYFLDDESAHKN